MNSVEAVPAAVGVAAPMVVPSEPVSIVVDEKLMVVLNKDGGVESMEVNGGMALQVLIFPCNVSGRASHCDGCNAPITTHAIGNCDVANSCMTWHMVSLQQHVC